MNLIAQNTFDNSNEQANGISSNLAVALNSKINFYFTFSVGYLAPFQAKIPPG